MDWVTQMRRQIAVLSETYANERGLPFYKSLGKHPTVMFERFDNETRHGNFIYDSYNAILANTEWRRRLGKKHQRPDALPETKRKAARELDSSNSSDALLMNIFCYPDAFNSQLAALFGLTAILTPDFGTEGKAPLSNGRTDTTEVDMKLGNVIFEAKLTEASFTSKIKSHVEKYDGLSQVFNIEQLTQTDEEYRSYQLIRNILVASHHNYSFFLLCHARRPDLINEYQNVHAAIRTQELQSRCGIILWQKIASVVPESLATFLSLKYGIEPG
jgi:uncharacterized protein (DUF1697 family)